MRGGKASGQGRKGKQGIYYNYLGGFPCMNIGIYPAYPARVLGFHCRYND